MTFKKPYALLFFLSCLCFISTSFAQPRLSETNLPSYYSGQVESEDNHEPSELFTDHFYLKPLRQTSNSIYYTPLENLHLQSLPCCNRGPPLT